MGSRCGAAHDVDQGSRLHAGCDERMHRLGRATAANTAAYALSDPRSACASDVFAECGGTDPSAIAHGVALCELPGQCRCRASAGRWCSVSRRGGGRTQLSSNSGCVTSRLRLPAPKQQQPLCSSTSTGSAHLVGAPESGRGCAAACCTALQGALLSQHVIISGSGAQWLIPSWPNPTVQYYEVQRAAQAQRRLAVAIQRGIGARCAGCSE